MAMRYQKALQGLLFSIIVTASIFVGLSVISQKDTGQRTFMVLQDETTPVTSDAASVPTWSEINHTRFAIDTQETPLPSTNVTYAGAGVSVLAGEINRTYNSAYTLNATNLQPQMNLSYTDRWTIRCTDHLAVSNFTVLLNTPLVNTTTTNTTLISNAKAIKIKWGGTHETSFAFNTAIFSPPIYNTIYPNVTNLPTVGHYFRFNIKNAVEILENTSLYTGASFLFEVNYTVTVQFTSWSMENKPGEKFRIEGNQSTRVSNYTLSFRVSGPKGANITFHYFTADLNCTSVQKFYMNNSLMSPQPVFDATLKGWRIAPGGSVKLNPTGITFKIEFRVNATVGFVDRKAGRWTSDGMTSRFDTRTRRFKLAVLSGPSTLLIVNVTFTANDIPYTIKIQGTSSVTPESQITITDDTYTYYDYILQQDMTRSNGTKAEIGRLQKANGPVTTSYNYNASYGATLRILDELRNPLSGAEVTLYFHGVRFGPLMSVNGSSLQPVKITNVLGAVTYSYLPEGNYSVVVLSQGRVKTQGFSLYGGAKTVTIDVVTDVPYQPWILFAWVSICGLLVVVGISLFKRKR